VVTGTVTYRERIALPPDAVVQVQLLDVSLMDVSAKLLAEQIIKPQHQVPIPFKLVYRPGDIDERMTYAVRATISNGDKLLFVTDRSYPVLTRGRPEYVDLVLIRP
jgi:putative lipoprotein